MYVVGIGGVAGISLKGERLLKRLASETGGRAFLPDRDTGLTAVHDALASDVQNRYSHFIYAVEPGHRRFVADDQRAGVGAGLVGPSQTGIFCAEATADSLLD